MTQEEEFAVRTRKYLEDWTMKTGETPEIVEARMRAFDEEVAKEEAARGVPGGVEVGEHSITIWDLRVCLGRSLPVGKTGHSMQLEHDATAGVLKCRITDKDGHPVLGVPVDLWRPVAGGGLEVEETRTNRSGASQFELAAEQLPWVSFAAGTVNGTLTLVESLDQEEEKEEEEGGR